MFLLLTYLCAILRRSRMPASTTMPAMPCQHGSFALSTSHFSASGPKWLEKQEPHINTRIVASF